MTQLFDRSSSTVRQASPSKFIPHPEDFIRDHPIWILSLTPFLLAALKLLVVSFGNVEILRYLVQNLDPVQLILATVIPLLPVGAFWLCLLVLFFAISPSVKVHTPRVGRVLAVVVLVPFLGYFALQGIFFSLVVNLALLSLLAVLWVVRSVVRSRFPAKQWRIGAIGARQSIVLIYMLMLAASLTTVASNWLPSEIIRTKNDPGPIVGYVVSSKDDWTVILTMNGGRDIRLVPKLQVSQREPCVYRSWTTRPLGEFMLDDPAIATCPGEKDWLDRWFYQFKPKDDDEEDEAAQSN